MTFVKICGVTRLEDAIGAAQRGANAIGFIMWPRSPRYVAPERACDIVASLPASVLTVGVFVNADPSAVNEMAERVGFKVVQLHGDETPEAAEKISRPVIKAVSGDAVDDGVRCWPLSVPLLVDAHDPERRGGTGVQADWTRAAGLARQRRVLLAGGLTPENVARAIAQVRPFGIDVSSGVECAPGLKDPAKLDALFKALEAMNR